MASVLLSEALDDVQAKSGVRCDGFTSSLNNSMLTITNGVAVSLLNGGMALFGYLAPAAGAIPTQPQAVRGFFTFCQLGVPLLAYPVLAALLYGMGKSQGSVKAAKEAA